MWRLPWSKYGSREAIRRPVRRLFKYPRQEMVVALSRVVMDKIMKNDQSPDVFCRWG